MNTTTHLARHILQFQPNKDAARLCFYHYLIHHCDPETPLNGQLVEDFARRALTYQHWRENRVLLSQELQYILQHYNETYLLDWSFKEISFPDNWQVVEVESRIEAIFIIERWVDQTFPKGSKKRIFYTQNNRYIAVIQTPKADLTVVNLSNQMLLRRGSLQPLCTDLRLQYTENLELRPKVPQNMLISENTTGRFYVHNNAVEGRMIRGYIFQHQQSIHGLLNHYPAIYYPLKNIEQYFIDRKTDPAYQELVQTLEKAVELIRLRHPEGKNFAKAALDRGQAALERLFTNDNTIQILVDELSNAVEFTGGLKPTESIEL